MLLLVVSSFLLFYLTLKLLPHGIRWAMTSDRERDKNPLRGHCPFLDTCNSQGFSPKVWLLSTYIEGASACEVASGSQACLHPLIPFYSTVRAPVIEN
jgi:hypothetical protein